MVDAAIALPADGGSLLLHAAAVGTQTYTCTAVADAGPDAAYAWVFVGPKASLADCNGTKIGEHSAPVAATAPQWTNIDGSMVEGRKVSAFAHDASAIPWLLLKAASHTGTGVMNRVDFVQRVDTVGGNAPTTACNAENVGASTDVGYSADYYFFGH